MFQSLGMFRLLPTQEPVSMARDGEEGNIVYSAGLQENLR